MVRLRARGRDGGPIYRGDVAGVSPPLTQSVPVAIEGGGEAREGRLSKNGDNICGTPVCGKGCEHGAVTEAYRGGVTGAS